MHSKVPLSSRDATKLQDTAVSEEQPQSIPAPMSCLHAALDLCSQLTGP